MITDDDVIKRNSLLNNRLLDTTNPLVLPARHKIILSTTSTDVIHSFTVPSLGIKIDSLPGRVNTINFFITEPGHYYGQCSELCGVNHGFMPIEIFCLDSQGFDIYRMCLLSSFIDTGYDSET